MNKIKRLTADATCQVRKCDWVSERVPGTPTDISGRWGAAFFTTDAVVQTYDVVELIDRVEADTALQDLCCTREQFFV
jgi:hypothetical protein